MIHSAKMIVMHEGSEKWCDCDICKTRISNGRWALQIQEIGTMLDDGSVELDINYIYRCIKCAVESNDIQWLAEPFNW